MCEYLSHMNFLSKLTFSLHISYTVIFFIFNFTPHKNKKSKPFKLYNFCASYDRHCHSSLFLADLYCWAYGRIILHTLLNLGIAMWLGLAGTWRAPLPGKSNKSWLSIFSSSHHSERQSCFLGSWAKMWWTKIPDDCWHINPQGGFCYSTS